MSIFPSPPGKSLTKLSLDGNFYSKRGTAIPKKIVEQKAKIQLKLNYPPDHCLNRGKLSPEQITGIKDDQNSWRFLISLYVSDHRLESTRRLEMATFLCMVWWGVMVFLAQMVEDGVSTIPFHSSSPPPSPQQNYLEIATCPEAEFMDLQYLWGCWA